jgi:hypothetical protein
MLLVGCNATAPGGGDAPVSGNTYLSEVITARPSATFAVQT